MILTQTETDKLDITLVKAHLVVDHATDDLLIESYIKASIGYVEAYIHDSILDNYFTNDQNELKLINMQYILKIPTAPKMVIVKVGQHTDILPDSAWNFSNGHVYIDQVSNITPTEITAMVGIDPKWSDSINQARLLLIGQFYNYRESIADLRILELPHGVKFILDNVTGASI